MRNFNDFVPKEFEEKVVQVNRVSKKTQGGNKIGFSVVVVIGDKKGRVGVGIGKAPEVQSAIKKGVAYAKKHLVVVPMRNGTIPHQVLVKKGAAKLLLKPAPSGSGVIAGGAVRAVVELAGIKDISSKVLGTNNQANNVYATFEALQMLRASVDKNEKKANDGEVEQVVVKENAVKNEVVVTTEEKPKNKTKKVKGN